MKMLLIAAALAAASVGAPAAAQDSEHVRTSDLDLTRRSDVRTLDRHLAAAARQVCADASSSTYGSYSAASRCRQATGRALEPQRSAALESARGTSLARR